METTIKDYASPFKIMEVPKRDSHGDILDYGTDAIISEESRIKARSVAFIKDLNKVTWGIVGLNVLLSFAFVLPKNQFIDSLGIVLGGMFLCFFPALITSAVLLIIRAIGGVHNPGEDYFRSLINSMAMGGLGTILTMGYAMHMKGSDIIPPAFFAVMIIGGYIMGALYGTLRKPFKPEPRIEWF